MKKFNLLAILIGISTAINGAELISDGYYPLDKIPEKAEINTPVYEDFEFKLEENITTGYTWQARYNPQEVKVEIDHDINKKHKQLGASGHADIEVELRRDKTAIVEFYYSRPFEKDVKPAIEQDKRGELNSEQLTRLLKRLNEMSKELSGKASEAASKAAKSIEHALPREKSTAEKGAEAAGELAQKAGEELKKSLPAIKELSSEVLNGMIAVLSQLLSSAAELLKK